MTGNMRPPHTHSPRHRVVKRPCEQGPPALSFSWGGPPVSRMGVGIPVKYRRNFNNLLILEITLDNIKKQVYIIRQ